MFKHKNKHLDILNEWWNFHIQKKMLKTKLIKQNKKNKNKIIQDHKEKMQNYN